MKVCPECKQTQPPMAGMKQAYKESHIRLIEIIRRAGPDGISSVDLLHMIHPDGMPEQGTAYISKRVYQLNKKLRRDGLQICALPAGPLYRDYFIERVEPETSVPLLRTPSATRIAARKESIGIAGAHP